MPEFDRYYTIEEANDLLPEVRAALAEIREIRDQLSEDYDGARPAIRASLQNGGGKEASAYVTGLSGLGRQLQWFSDRGILVKDIDRGLVDFPALRNGEEVLLCWELAEDHVAYWHDLESGYAGRQRW